MSHLSIDFSFWKALVCIGAVGLTVYYCINNLRHGEKSKGLYFLESLRFLILILFVMTFLEPEWVKVNNKQDKPELIVAWDDSGSMDTEDVVVDGKVIKRTDLTKTLLESICE